MRENFIAIKKRVGELRKDETLSLLDMEFIIAREFGISFGEAVENITLCALAESFGV